MIGTVIKFVHATAIKSLKNDQFCCFLLNDHSPVDCIGGTNRKKWVQLELVIFADSLVLIVFTENPKKSRDLAEPRQSRPQLWNISFLDMFG